jgi:hypothetical protein
VFLRGKGQILGDVTVNTPYVHLINFLAPGSRDMHYANNKAVDYLFRSLCQSKFDRVQTKDLACSIWLALEMLRFRNGCMRLTKESTGISLISPVSQLMPCSSGSWWL